MTSYNIFLEPVIVTGSRKIYGEVKNTVPLLHNANAKGYDEINDDSQINLT